MVSNGFRRGGDHLHACSSISTWTPPGMATPFRPCLIGSEEAFELLEGLQQAPAPGAEQQQQPGVFLPAEAQPAGTAAAPGQAVATSEALPSSPTASPAVHRVEGLDDSQTPGHVLLPVPVSPPSDPATRGEQQREAAVAQPPRATTSAAQAYLSECRVVQVDPHRWILELFNTVPECLWVPFQPRVMPRTHAGGTVLSLKSKGAAATAGEPAVTATASGDSQQPSVLPSELQLLAALRVLFGGQDGGDSNEPFWLLLLHHLDLSGIQLGPEVAMYLLKSGERLRHWHTLAGLSLSGCGLHREFFAQVGCADSLDFYRSLTRLDLSHNPLGIPSEGQPFKAYDALSFAFMWREAPLTYVNLAHTGLTASDLDHLLWRLCEYGPLRESTGQAVGPAPEGTRATLRYLELGPPGGDGVWESNLVGRLQQTIQALPLLERLVVHGLVMESQQQQLAAAWRAAKGEGAECRTGVLPGEPPAFCLSSLPLEQRCSVEEAPQEHVLPGPETPPTALQQMDEANFLDGGSAGRAQHGNSGPQLVQQRIDAMPALGQGEAADDLYPGLLPPRRPKPPTGRPPRAQGQSQQHAQLHQALQAGGGGRQRARTEEPPVRETVPMLQQQVAFRRQQSQQHTLGGNTGRSGLAAQPWGQPSGQQRAAGRGSSRTKGSQRPRQAGRAGGGREDQLPSFEVDLMQESPPDAAGLDEDDYYDDGEGEESGGEAANLNTQRARDREIADDDKMAPIYRKEVKIMISKIEDGTDREEASKMYKIYTSTAFNAWDRRRWQNPDKQFKDLPQQLGTLNRLYDLLDAHHMRPQFPFPLWQPGGGREAFEKPSPVRVAPDTAGAPQLQGAAAAPRQAQTSVDDAAQAAARRRHRKQQARRAAQRFVVAGSESESDLESPQASQDSFLAPDGLPEEEAGGGTQGFGPGFQGASPAVVDLVGDSSPSGAGQPQQLERAVSRTTAATSRRKQRVVDLSESDSSEEEEREPQTTGVRAATGIAAAHEGPPQTTELKLRFHHQLASLPLPSPLPPPLLSPAANGATGAPLRGKTDMPADTDLGHAPAAMHTELSQRFNPPSTDANLAPGPVPQHVSATAQGKPAGEAADGAGGGRHRKSRELESLIPFEWDKHKLDHPPNAEVFGMAEGKRQRRGLLPDSQLQRLLDDSQQREAPPSQADSDLWQPEEESDEPVAELGTEDEPLAKRWKQQQQQQQRVATNDPHGSQSDDSDDGIPLGQLAAKRQACSTNPGDAQQPMVSAQQGKRSSDDDLPQMKRQPTPVGQLRASNTLVAQLPPSPVAAATKVVAANAVPAGSGVTIPAELLVAPATELLAAPPTAACQVSPAPGHDQALQSAVPHSAPDLGGQPCQHSGSGTLRPLAAAAAAGLNSYPPAHEGVQSIEKLQPGCQRPDEDRDQQPQQQQQEMQAAHEEHVVPEVAWEEGRPATGPEAADNPGQQEHSAGQPDIQQAILCIPDSEEQEIF